jgi:hypothetical protein
MAGGWITPLDLSARPKNQSQGKSPWGELHHRGFGWVIKPRSWGDHHALDLPPDRQCRFPFHGRVQRGRGIAGSAWRIGLADVQGSRIWNPRGLSSEDLRCRRGAEKGVGQRFESDDGRATLSIYARENEEGDTPASYLRKNLRQSGLDYERITRSFFAISMEREGTIYYSRCNFSRSARSAIHCFDLIYPQDEKRDWDPVVTRISLSLRPLER